MSLKYDSQNFNPVTHVIFDLDGLLLDTEHKYEEAINNVCMKYGSSYTPEAKYQTVGRSTYEAAEIVVKLCHLPITPDQAVMEVQDEYIKVFEKVEFMPGAKRLVLHLAKHKIPLAIATSGQTSTFHLKSKNYKDIFDLFHHIVFATDDPKVKHGKPAPDVYQVTSSRFQIEPKSPEHVLVFEDATVGVIGALAAGMKVVWVPDPTNPDIKNYNPTLLLQSLEMFQPELFGLPKFD